MRACGGYGSAVTVKSRSKLVCDAFVLHEAVIAGRLNSLLIQTHGIGVPPLEAGDLGRHECVLIGESRWIGFGPLAQLLSVRRQEFAPGILLVDRSLVIERRYRQRGVEEVVE
jgi:hypothetical protein